MLSIWVYLCGTTDQWSIDPTDPRNPYISKQMNFSYLPLVTLPHAESLLSNHLHELLVDLILIGNRFQICPAWLVSPCQFTMSFRKNRQKWSVIKHSKRVIWVREHSLMTSIQKVGGSWALSRVCEFYCFYTIGLLFLFPDGGIAGGEIKKLVIFCGRHKWMTTNLRQRILLLPRILEIIIQVI